MKNHTKSIQRQTFLLQSGTLYHSIDKNILPSLEKIIMWHASFKPDRSKIKFNKIFLVHLSTQQLWFGENK